MTTTHWILISVTALLTFTALVFKFGSWYGEVNSDRKVFKEFMHKVDKRMQKVDKRMQRVDERMEKVDERMEKFDKRIDDILNRLSPPPTITESPIRLSELGEQISKNVGAKAWAAEVAQELVDQTKGMNPFEVQTLSFEHAKSFEPGDELLAKMQQSAYESGLDLEGVERVLGVELRDHLLQLNNLS